MKFFEFIERHKFGIFGTIAVHLVIYIWFNVQAVVVYDNVPTERTVAILDFSETTEDQDELPTEESNDLSDASSTHQNLTAVANNASQEKTTYTQSFNASATDQAVWEELKALEQAEYDRIQANQSPTENTNQDDMPQEMVNPNLIDKNASADSKAAFGMDVKAVATYYLPGRSTLQQRLPAYKCKAEGTVRVNIKVSQKGEVAQASIDESHTNTANTCLRNEAIKYAKKWFFNQNFSDDFRKQGWIEFAYIAQ